MELRDGDLLLRPVERGDADALAIACDDDDIARFVTGMPSPYTREDAEEWVERCAEVWRTGEAFPFAIVDAETGALVGAIELDSGSVGYWVAREARGRGVATRALRLVCALDRRSAAAPNDAPGERGLAAGRRARWLPPRGHDD